MAHKCFSTLWISWIVGKNWWRNYLATSTIRHLELHPFHQVVKRKTMFVVRNILFTHILWHFPIPVILIFTLLWCPNGAQEFEDPGISLGLQGGVKSSGGQDESGWPCILFSVASILPKINFKCAQSGIVLIKLFHLKLFSVLVIQPHTYVFDILFDLFYILF